MLNTDYFISRLEKLMETNQLSAAAFAEKIGVQRSSVSHILSKRNKPSLEFILKIHAAFEGVGLEWLVIEGAKQTALPLLTTDVPETDKIVIEQDEKPLTSDLPPSTHNDQDVIQIIQLYQDGSFRTFFPKT
jgi:transcriptional regulator with XRE-family HTH domain